jgi:hypothetical protein
MTGYDVWKLAAPEDDELELCDECGRTLLRCRCGQERDDDCPEGYDGN